MLMLSDLPRRLHENLRKKSDFTLAKSKLAMWFPHVKRET
jgi:hypothetical protein